MTVERVSAGEAYGLIVNDGYHYLDLRSTLEFAIEHPEGAYNIPLYLSADEGGGPNPDLMSTVRRGFAPGAKLVVACRSGVDSLPVAHRLAAAGYQVVELRPGFEGKRGPFGELQEEGWRQAGLPCANRPFAGHDYRSLSGETDDDQT